MFEQRLKLWRKRRRARKGLFGPSLYERWLQELVLTTLRETRKELPTHFVSSILTLLEVGKYEAVVLKFINIAQYKLRMSCKLVVMSTAYNKYLNNVTLKIRAYDEHATYVDIEGFKIF